MYQVGDIRRKSQRRLKLRLIVFAAVIVAGLLVYFLLYKTGLVNDQGTPETITSVETVEDSLSEKLFDTVHIPEKEVVIQTDSQIADLANNENVKKATPPATSKSQDIETTEEKMAERLNNTAYKVISIAHFHTKPDADTRRSAFINHWNNAVLQPLDDKNGFIYIVFTNDEGRTTKGWLRKKDLKPIKAGSWNSNTKE